MLSSSNDESTKPMKMARRHIEKQNASKYIRAESREQDAESRLSGSQKFLVSANLATSVLRGSRYLGTASTACQKIEGSDQNDCERVEEI